MSDNPSFPDAQCRAELQFRPDQIDTKEFHWDFIFTTQFDPPAIQQKGAIVISIAELQRTPVLLALYWSSPAALLNGHKLHFQDYFGLFNEAIQNVFPTVSVLIPLNSRLRYDFKVPAFI